MSKQRYGIWREVSHQIFGDRCKEVWDFLWGAPREFDRGHMLMWLCQMVYAKVILGVDIDWSTIPRTSAELKVARRTTVIPSGVLGRNTGRPIPLAWFNPPEPPRSFFEFLAPPGHQHADIHTSNNAYIDDYNTVIGMPVEPPSRRQRVDMSHMSTNQLVPPPSSPVDVDMAMDGPPPQLEVAHNDVVEALRSELAKCKLDHERELEFVRREHSNEVAGLNARIDELTEVARVKEQETRQAAAITETRA